MLYFIIPFLLISSSILHPLPPPPTPTPPPPTPAPPIPPPKPFFEKKKTLGNQFARTSAYFLATSKKQHLALADPSMGLSKQRIDPERARTRCQRCQRLGSPVRRDENTGRGHWTVRFQDHGAHHGPFESRHDRVLSLRVSLPAQRPPLLRGSRHGTARGARSGRHVRVLFVWIRRHRPDFVRGPVHLAGQARVQLRRSVRGSPGL